MVRRWRRLEVVMAGEWGMVAIGGVGSCRRWRSEVVAVAGGVNWSQLAMGGGDSFKWCWSVVAIGSGGGRRWWCSEVAVVNGGRGFAGDGRNC